MDEYGGEGRQPRITLQFCIKNAEIGVRKDGTFDENVGICIKCWNLYKMLEFV